MNRNAVDILLLLNCMATTFSPLFPCVCNFKSAHLSSSFVFYFTFIFIHSWLWLLWQVADNDMPWWLRRSKVVECIRGSGPYKNDGFFTFIRKRHQRDWTFHNDFHSIVKHKKDQRNWKFFVMKEKKWRRERICLSVYLQLNKHMMTNANSINQLPSDVVSRKNVTVGEGEQSVWHSVGEENWFTSPF